MLFRTIVVGVSLACLASTQDVTTQDAGMQESCTAGVTTNIDWVLPGEFDAALARARREGKLLLIKGVSFGIDDAGAKCATKGKW